jgi:hypothetical protein
MLASEKQKFEAHKQNNKQKSTHNTKTKINGIRISTNFSKPSSVQLRACSASTGKNGSTFPIKSPMLNTAIIMMGIQSPHRSDGT